MNNIWRGAGKTLKNPAKFTSPGFTFGGKHFPKGVEVKQFETRDFGWTIARVDKKTVIGKD